MPFHVLLISGSTRSGSTNTAVLRTAASIAPDGVTTTLFGRLSDLPAFNPDDDYDPLHPAVVELRTAIAAADAILFCTPEYAGALPGSFKNLLDWTVGGPEMDGQPVAWLNVASIAAPTGGADAHASLAKVMGYIKARIIDPACRRIPMTRQAVGPDGTVTDPDIRAEIIDAIQTLQREVPPTPPEPDPPTGPTAGSAPAS